MKKLFTFLLALIAGASMSLQAFDVVKVGELYYELDKPKAGEAQVTFGNSDDTMDDIENTKRYKGAIVIPPTINYNSKTYTVTAIDYYYTDLPSYREWYGAFANCDELTAITIPNTVTERIFPGTFENCSSLTAIAIPNATAISVGVFEGCTSLEVISLGSGVKEMDNGISVSYSNIDDYGIAKVLNQKGIPALKSIQVDAANPNYCSVDGVLFNKDTTILLNYPASKEGTSYTIPASVKTIGVGAFMDNKYLQTINIPEGVTLIRNLAFFRATGLKSITIPATVEWLNQLCFTNCTSLESVVIQNGTTITRTELLFSGCSSLKSVQLPNTEDALRAQIPTDLHNTIGWQMFSGCSSLLGFTAPYGVETIGDDAFANCSSMAIFTLPDSLKANGIGSDAFYGCTSLQTFTIANANEAYATTDGVLYTKDKGSLLVYPSGKASDLFVPESTITAIAADAFHGATQLKAINIPDGVTTIGDNAFEKCNQLTSLVLPKKLTSIGEDAFKDCSNLASVTFPEGLISIGASAFDSDKKLTHIEIPSTVTTIGARAFAICTGLKSFTCNATVPPTLGDFCFVSVPETTPFYVPELAYDTYKDFAKWKTLNLQPFAPLRYDFKTGFVATLLPPAGTMGYSGDIVLPEVVAFGGFDYTVTGIGANAFRGATKLQSVSIPKTVTAVGDAAFYGATNLAQISVDPDNTNLVSVDNVLMNNAQTTIIAYAPNQKSTEFTTPATVTKIGLGAFAEAKNLQELTLTENVATISEGAFVNCEKLKSITSEAVTPPACTVIGKGTSSEETPFDGIDKDIFVIVPASSVTAYQNADGWNYFNKIQGPFDPATTAAYELVDLSTETITEGKYLIVFDDNKAHAAVSGKDLIASSDELAIIKGVAYVSLEAAACAVTIAPLGVDSFSILLANGTSYLHQKESNAVTSLDTPSAFAISDGGDKTVQIAKLLPADGKTYVLKHNHSGSKDYYRMYTSTVQTLPYLYRLKEVPTEIETIGSSSLQGGDRGRLILRDGQILILRDGKVYTITGQQVQ